MSSLRSQTVRELPTWITVVGSLVIVTHLLCIGALVLAAPSGPWATASGTNMASGPPFAREINDEAAPNYLRPLKMTHNYHFATNHPVVPGVWLEVQLKDDQGNDLDKIVLPDPKANRWVQHRQALMVKALADDQTVEPLTGESIPAPDQEAKTVLLWEPIGPQQLLLRPTPEHLIPRERMAMRPSEWSLILVRSYARYLCRKHGANSAVVIRHTKEPVHPGILFTAEPPPGTFAELISNFGEFPR